MSKFKSGLWKGICVAVVVPILMVLAVPVRAFVHDGAPQAPDAVSPDAAVVMGNVTSLDSVPLPDVTVTTFDEDGNVLAMATTGPDGEYAMEVPAAVGKVTVVPEGGSPKKMMIRAGGAVEVHGDVPAAKLMGDAQPGWWSGMSTTSKAAIVGLPVAASAGVGFALADDGSSRQASPTEF